MAEDSSLIAPIHFVCRPGPSFVSSTHALQIIARCDRGEPTGEARMFMQRNCAGQAEAVSLEILTDATAATMVTAEPADPFVFVAYRAAAVRTCRAATPAAHQRWRRMPVSWCATSLPCTRIRMGVLGQPRPLNGRNAQE
ncbi:MAG TPA: hypothetical protein VG011_07790 [Steroidobacteraceae bacterium]|nr:hypothetical protein [Steroidobacteraceae bacterium]